jgi:archaellum biogenesis ATPase FlaH
VLGVGSEKNKKMNERKIVSAILKDRKSWELLKDRLEPGELSPESNTLLRLASTYYESDSTAQHCDLEILKPRLEREIQSAKLVKVLFGILDTLPDVSSVNLTAEVLELKRHAVGLKLSSALAAGKHGTEVSELIDQYVSMVGITDVAATSEEQTEITGVSVDELFEKAFNSDNLIKIFPKSLNERLDGGARPGHHILVFAPTEMGKTLVAINMVAGFLHQKIPVLYIGNEDPAADILLRLGTRLSGMNKYEIRDNPKKAQELIDQRSAGLFTIAPLAPGTFGEISALVRKYQPKVVVLDQLRNIDVKSENRTQALEKAATEARNLAKRHGLVVISIAQAGDSASGKAALNRGDVDSSNVGIPGQCDVMIGIGATEEMERNNSRMFSFPKNKLSGNHQPITVTIDPQLSKVIDNV